MNILKRIVEWLKASRLSKNKLGKFILEVLVEMIGVTWPSKDEVVSSTVVVLITLVIFAVFLYVVNLMVGPVLDQFGVLITRVFS